MVPSIAVMPRDGSFALAVFGRMRKVHESPFSLSAGRKSFALKRILEAVLFICLVLLIVMHFLDTARFTRLARSNLKHLPRHREQNDIAHPTVSLCGESVQRQINSNNRIQRD